MSVELSTWRPLWEFSAILIVLGAAGCLSSRDRMFWWQSQGLIVLGVMVGFAAIGAMHPHVDLFSLGVWIPLVLALELVVIYSTDSASMACCLVATKHDGTATQDHEEGRVAIRHFTTEAGSVGIESTDPTEL
jgi:hypothetical protein